MVVVASREKWSFKSVMWAPAGRLPTQKAYPDCLGFRGGPRGADGMAALVELALPLRTAVEVSKRQHEVLPNIESDQLPGMLPGRRKEDPPG